MGEKIKILKKIDLNKSSVKGVPRYIHIKNEIVRFCLTENDFLQIALNIKKSSEMFKYNKGMKNKL